MKKLIALLLVVAFVCAGSVGCGSGESKKEAPKTPPAGGAPGGGGAPKAPGK